MATSVVDVTRLLEYRFGWRWLLPIDANVRILTFGLSDQETAWWSHNVGPSSLKGGVEKECWIIALGMVHPVDVAEKANKARPNWLCAWGTGGAVGRLRGRLEGFVEFREYAMLPANHPRVLVPLSDARNTGRGLGLHQPGRWMARLGINIASALLRFGCDGLLRRRVLILATRSSDVLPGAVRTPSLMQQLPIPPIDFALYLGTATEHRKTIVLPLGKSPTRTILKVAETATARAALGNEADALRALSNSLLARQVPRLVGLFDDGNRLTLAQEYRPRIRTRNMPVKDSVAIFLTELSSIERIQVPLRKWLTQSRLLEKVGCQSDMSELESRFAAEMDYRAEQGAAIVTHRIHGDFAPWNSSWSEEGLFVFDWEESCAHGIALGDAFYYVLAPFLHVGKRRITTANIDMAFQFANRVRSQSGEGAIDVDLYFALWLAERMSKPGQYGLLLATATDRLRSRRSPK
jgi:Phosphotransferase enzyme family